MGLTQFQKLELNKRTDKILHAPANAPAGTQQLEIAFVADIKGDTEYIHSSIKDAVAALKSHDKIFQNVRSNMVYWGSRIVTKVTPMSFIQMGKAFEDIEEHIGTGNEGGLQNFETLCGYLKLYHARCRCIFVFVDCDYAELEKQRFRAEDFKLAIENLNPFLKYRILIITRNKMVAGSELLMKFIAGCP